jgi:hypothetical protein
VHRRLIVLRFPVNSCVISTPASFPNALFRVRKKGASKNNLSFYKDYSFDSWPISP